MRWAVPGLLVALFAFGCGTFEGAATAWGAAAGAGAVLGVALLADPRDPWRLGAARLLPWALLAAAAASVLCSPVPRAGRTALVLLPAYLLLPDALARCWRAAGRQRAAARLVAGTVLALSVTALAVWLAGRSARPSAPLGHHNLLAAVLVTLAPLALPPPGEVRRWAALGWASAVAAVTTVALSRSLAGALGVATAAAVLAPRRPRALGLALLFGAAVVAVPLAFAGVAGGSSRGAALVRGADPSLRARAVYLEGAARGVAARPLLGWGVGSTPWTLALHLRPRLGLNPPGEVVGEPHALPAAIVYELGVVGAGLVVALAVTFVRRRGAAAPGDLLARRATAGLAGFAVCALGGAPLAVTALPVAVAVALGAALPDAPGAPPRGLAARAAGAAYAALAALALLPVLLATAAYERASTGSSVVAAQRLARAIRLDPLPLYEARLAWLSPLDSVPAAERSRAAARTAAAVGPLWIAAAQRGIAAGAPWAESALRQACRLDPLSGLPPALLALRRPAAAEAPTRLALAFLAEPRLAAASGLTDLPQLRAAALRRIERLDSVDAGWRVALLEAARLRPGAGGSQLVLRLEADRDPTLSFALHAFRRRRWPAVLVEIPLDATAAARLGQLPPAPISASGWSRELDAAHCR
jgi:hypothetical protein